MGKAEKESLINGLSVSIAEACNISIKQLKAIITENLVNYHITYSQREELGGDTSTEYLLKMFVEGKRSIGMKEKTINQYKIAVSKLEEFTSKKLSDIEPEDINKFLLTYGKNVSSVTLRAKYQLLSSLYNYLFNHKYINYNPMLYIDAPKIVIKYKEPLSDLNYEKIKKACEELPEKESIRDMAILYFFTSSGCRVSEIANIKLCDIDFYNKTCKVMGKGNKERLVILTDKAIYRIKLYLDTRKNNSPDAPLFGRIRGEEEALTKDGLERIVKKITNRAGIKNVTCHSFRRYYATELRKRNVSIQMIASSLGHANLNQINRYSLYNNSEMLNTIRSSM